MDEEQISWMRLQIVELWIWAKKTVVLLGLMMILALVITNVVGADIVMRWPSMQNTCVFDESFADIPQPKARHK